VEAIFRRSILLLHVDFVNESSDFSGELRLENRRDSILGARFSLLNADADFVLIGAGRFGWGFGRSFGFGRGFGFGSGNTGGFVGTV